MSTCSTKVIIKSKDCNYGLEFQPKVLSDDHMFEGKKRWREGEEEIKVN